MIKLNAKQLRVSEPDKEDLKKIKRNPITIIVDNVLDTYNIGAIFRLADAVAAEKIYLCGKTETPPYHRIQKASVGTWAWVPWEQLDTTEQAIEKVRKENPLVKVVAIEQHTKSTPFRRIDYSFPICFIVGHETNGISKDVLKMADFIAEIPMYGVNKSLNVMVSLAIIMFWAIETIDKKTID